MPPFRDNPSIKYLGDGKWMLTEDFVYFHAVEGMITVPEGTITDLDSVPRLPFAYMLTKNASVLGALVHDDLYQKGYIQGENITRAEADGIFLDLMEEEGVSWWQRRMIWLGVRLGGWIPWNKHRDADPTFI